MTRHTRRLVLGVLLCAVVYVASYVGFRVTHVEVWDHDGREYVIIQQRLLYYAYRPIMYLDAALTGMGFHIGPHQEAEAELE